MSDARDDLGDLERLKRHLEPELSDCDVERLLHGASERRLRRHNRGMLGIGLGLGTAASLVLVVLLRLAPATSATGGTKPSAGARPSEVAALGSAAIPAPSVERRAPEVITLADQSRAIPLAPETRLAVEEDAAERVHLRLERGQARFEVTRRPERSFTVRAASVTVSVIGTTFGVEVVADRVAVNVEKGVVEVDWGVGQKRLLAGESGWFPPLVLSGEAAAPSDGSPPPSKTGHSSSAPVAGSARSAARGAPELLADVDAARAAGHPDRAVELLKQLLRDYPRDPRAPLAAFTLGRVLLNELGRPREAAAAFNDVRRMAPASQFAEDALAREVEAWSRASEPSRARALAATYLERYPSGRHAPRLKALAGLE
ncbi:MAG TPA: FecR domain-containing protein [Polyangiaceae bacterium]|nr:FecR domain-containing protein [Polyangiaceae bacterium]